jgi:hypothetical protein
MSTKKDMRRPDLSKLLFYARVSSSTDNGPVIPFQLPAPKESASDISGTLGSTLPMAAMFTRNKFIGWYAYSGGAGEDTI